MTTAEKFANMGGAVLAFAAVLGLILFIAGKVGERGGGKPVALLFLLPTVLFVAVGLIYPASLTIFQSFYNAGGDSFVGFDNYKTIFTTDSQLIVIRNTVLWVVFTPFVATAIGLVYAILVDGAKLEALAKSLIFLPMAISFVAASIIWKFVYAFRPDQGNIQQIGILNQILVWFGGSPQNWLVGSPLNTFLLIAILIWIQAGFAMTILSAAIKAIPADITEAARLDGASTLSMFRFVTLPSIRPSVVVVLTTIGIATLKIFDIVRVVTGGSFETSVIANEFYSQSFRSSNLGLGSALAVLLFVLVVPIVAYNIRQMRASEAS